MSERINEMAAMDYASWYNRKVSPIAKPFKGKVVGNARAIEEKCEEISALQEEYGDFLIRCQKEEEQAAYEQRKARRERKMNAQKPAVGSLGELLKSALK